MNILDRITLLRAGYSRKEIEEMIKEEQAKPEVQEVQEPEPEEQKQEVQEEQKPEPEEKKPEIDYKSLYEKEKAAREALQKANRRRDNSGNDQNNDEETLKDIVCSFI